MAICSGSVSPSTSTSTGAFILRIVSAFPCHRTRGWAIGPVHSAVIELSNLPDLQRAGTEYTRSLVLGHVRCGAAVLVCDLLVFYALDGVERFGRLFCRCHVSARDNVVHVVVHVAIRSAVALRSVNILLQEVILVDEVVLVLPVLVLATRLLRLFAQR
jgi:hypothetical protein